MEHEKRNIWFGIVSVILSIWGSIITICYFCDLLINSFGFHYSPIILKISKITAIIILVGGFFITLNTPVFPIIYSIIAIVVGSVGMKKISKENGNYGYKLAQSGAISGLLCFVFTSLFMILQMIMMIISVLEIWI